MHPEEKGASVRQVLLNELVDSSTEVTTPMTMQGQVEEGWTLVQPRQTYMTPVHQLARVLESVGGHTSNIIIKSENLAWKKKNDTIFRVLEGSAEGDTGCGDTSNGDEPHIKSENFARYKKYMYSRLGHQLQIQRLAADRVLEAASRLRCAIEVGSSAASTTALGELTSKVSAKTIKGKCGSAQLNT